SPSSKPCTPASTRSELPPRTVPNTTLVAPSIDLDYRRSTTPTMGSAATRQCTNVARALSDDHANAAAHQPSVDVHRTTGVKLRGPEGAQRLRVTSASTSELDCGGSSTIRPRYASLRQATHNVATATIL